MPGVTRKGIYEMKSFVLSLLTGGLLLTSLSQPAPGQGAGGQAKIGDHITLQMPGWPAPNGAVILKEGPGNFTVRLDKSKYYHGVEELQIMPKWILSVDAAPLQQPTTTTTAPAAATAPKETTLDSLRPGDRVRFANANLDSWMATGVVESVGVGGMNIRTEKGAHFQAGEKLFINNKWIREVNPPPVAANQAVANPPKTTPPPPVQAPVAPPSGQGGLSGLFMRFESVFVGTQLSYREDHYFFFPDGRVYGGDPPEGPSRFNWEQALRDKPHLCGRYAINGGTITFQWGSSKPQQWKFERKGEDLVLNGLLADKVDTFSGRLSGTYSRGVTTPGGAGTATLTASSIYTFYPDGTFVNANRQTADGGAFTRVAGNERGTYRVSGNDMELRKGGEVLYCTGYPQNLKRQGTAESPERLSIGGQLFERVR